MLLTSEQNEDGIEITSLEQLLENLGKLHGGHNSFMVLNAEQSYVQCAGSKTALTIEYRQVFEENNFQHFVIGKGTPNLEVKTNVKFCGGDVEVCQSEVLNIKDVETCFAHFFQHQTLPEQYHQRDVSKDMIEDEEEQEVLIQINYQGPSKKITKKKIQNYEELIVENINYFEFGKCIESSENDNGRSIVLRDIYDLNWIHLLVELAEDEEIEEHIVISARAIEYEAEYTPMYPH